jgi:hypothetical protein
MRTLIFILALAMVAPAMAMDESKNICSKGGQRQVISLWMNHWIEETMGRMERQRPDSVTKMIDQGGDALPQAVADKMESISNEGAWDLKRKVYNECRVRLEYTEALDFWGKLIDAIRYDKFFVE